MSDRRTPTPPFSLRLTFEERAMLEIAAADMPLGAYIRSRVFDEARPRKTRQRRRVADQKALAKLLGELGQARLANNLNQLARAANTGSLPVTPETEKALIDACHGVEWMRVTLMLALGLRAMDGQ